MFEYTPLADAALAISVVSSLLYVVYYQLRAVTIQRALSKTVATGALVVAAWAGGVSLLYVGALIFAVIGDYMKSLRSERSFGFAIAATVGMQVLVCFWFAQVLWIGIEAPLVAVVGILGIFGGGFVLIWPRLGSRKSMMVPFAVTSIIMLTLGLGASPGRPELILGVILYLLSLILIGFELVFFNDRYRFLRISGPIVWMLYYSGLILMMIGGAG
ncbi:lysoplasmalogenase family protein [Pontivivens nitratireducens]|uniref:YhhN-like protein n=1 Tax=Pontivivens nitratireducens TaxID=2758038 RepID=A0A6G7VLP0_9RHOB|nr:lysoplasmalogenase family protein [Pontibrevibacter nitratireducens]QIK40786.1 hypothetical protein G8E03_08420 [Pontibrevibacter nitratireducens]